MKNNAIILFLVAFTVIATAITTPMMETDNQENIFKNIQTLELTSLIGIESQENIFKSIQCYGYYGC
jgi:hypothetical protein